MGTSSDYSGGTGGAWTPFKVAATNYAKRGGSRRGERVLARHVAALGGAGAATRSARAGLVGAQRAAEFLAGIVRVGFGEALRQAGLAHLVGGGRFEIVSALVDLLAGTGNDLEEQAARAATLDLIDELFADREDYDDLAAIELDAAGLVAALEAFIAAYVYNRLLPQIDERLTRFADPRQAERLDGDLRQLIRAQVRIELSGIDPIRFDWSGSEGRRIIERLIRSVYSVLEGLE